MTTEERGGAADACRGITDRALDLADGHDGFRLFGRGGGLHSRRRVIQAIVVGDGEGVGSTWARRLIDEDRLPPGDGIVCLDRKNGNWFDMSARALGYTSAPVEGYIIQIVGKDGRDAAGSIPNAVMSVYA